MNILVTGATGFLGSAVARRLQTEGVRVTATGRNLARGQALEAAGICFRAAELCDDGAIRRLCQGQDVVIHAAALSSPWGKFKDFYSANVTGTENVIAACQLQDVKRLIYISTPSVYADYKPHLNIPEDFPLPEPINHYAATKRTAEDKVKQAYSDGLASLILRPRALFGEGDTAILPRLLKRLERGKLRIIGDSETVVDLTYIDNAVDAVWLSVNASEQVLGNTYNISNGEAVRVWDKIERLAQLLKLEPPRRQISLKNALRLAGALEWLYARLPGYPEPPLTRYTVSALASSLTLDISRARRDLGYAPRVTVDEGLERFVHWWRAQA